VAELGLDIDFMKLISQQQDDKNEFELLVKYLNVDTSLEPSRVHTRPESLINLEKSVETDDSLLGTEVIEMLS
jgi:hypothetical protein